MAGGHDLNGQKRMRGLHGLKLVHRRSTSDKGDSESSEDARARVRWRSMNVRSMWEKRPAWLAGYSFLNTGDKSVFETLLNVITSLPFVYVGLQAPRDKLLSKLYADSVIGIGLASSAYHSSRGGARKYFRWGDYGMIATAAMCLSRALHPKVSNVAFLASAMLLPYHPLLVTSIHTGSVEATFARRAFFEPDLRQAYMIHAITFLAGGALFVADDYYPHVPYIHAAWHLVAAFGVSTYAPLLN